MSDSGRTALPAMLTPDVGGAPSGAPASRSAATRRDLKRHVARVEKLLEDAGEALQLLGKDLGCGVGDAYKELRRTAQALHRDAQRTNQRMLRTSKAARRGHAFRHH